jgi:hypothetical protein
MPIDFARWAAMQTDLAKRIDRIFPGAASRFHSRNRPSEDLRKSRLNQELTSLEE